jgi:hypothetical protein
VSPLRRHSGDTGWEEAVLPSGDGFCLPRRQPAGSISPEPVWCSPRSLTTAAAVEGAVPLPIPARVRRLNLSGGRRIAAKLAPFFPFLQERVTAFAQAS